ncbi:MAG TPA: hypothetical protein DEF45_22915 [Rhodopirellula sp.]|jgi:LSD1 subclass zinc finger protein|nr:MAG: hypothetical protein CBD74_05455 [Saprospirales bacterium TMED214]HBV65865.1 hypothetical protein [Rhodopirellula sp.]
MELERLVCNSCGAPLEVPSSAKFVTCSHCSGVLQIRRTESAIYTELLADIAEKTEELSERIDDLATNSELNAIDNQWQIERESLMVHNKHGKSQIPTRGSSMAAGIIVTIFGCIWTVMAINITSSSGSVGAAKGVFPAFGILFILFGIYNSISNFKKAEKYERAERRYRQRRSEAKRS